MKPTRRPSVSLYSVRNRDVRMNSQNAHKWWYTLLSPVFSLSSSFSPLIGGSGGLVCESVGKADLFSDHFDGKESRESVDCHSLDIRLRNLPPLHSGQERSGFSR